MPLLEPNINDTKWSNHEKGQFLGSCCFYGDQYCESILRLLPFVTGLALKGMRLVKQATEK